MALFKAVMSGVLAVAALAAAPEHRIGRLTIKPEPNVETMYALVQLSDGADAMKPRRETPPMHAKARQAFAAFKADPAVQELDGKGSLAIGRRFSEDTVCTLPLHFADLPDGKRIAEYSDEFLTRVVGPMPKGEKIQFLDDYWEKVRAFYRASHFDRFLAENERTYAGFVEDIRQSLPQSDMVSLYEEYVGEKGFDEYRVVPAPLTLPAGGAFGPRMTIAQPAKKVAFSILGTLYNSQSQRYDYRNKEFAQDTVIHEFGHSFCNPIAEAQMEEGNKYERLMKGVQQEMAAQDYPVWEAVLYEYLVRSVSARLTLALDGEKAAREALRKEREEHFFVFIDDFYAALETYEKSRDRYPTLKEFYPRLLQEALGARPSKALPA
ncbi:MAG: DUF4932 domain-containing protein [Elusimicrobia bacterium]|nr:DUF4932 domain-containing protein [Elusimicrobiota bacterium]